LSDLSHSNFDEKGRRLCAKKEVTMPLTALREYLDRHDVKYIILSHSPAYTAQGIAALAHIPGKELAKTVIVKLDGELAMAVLPATFHVDLALLKKATGAQSAEIASEKEFKDQFPECETGAMPPFGNLYGLDVFADRALTDDDEIAFNACSHRELIRMAWYDFERLVRPRVIAFAGKRSAVAA
jgi:Ala-tRNA(Pro) deacylase